MTAPNERFQPKAEPTEQEQSNDVNKQLMELKQDVDHLNSINFDLLLTDMHELAKELDRLQTGLTSIGTVEQQRSINDTKRRFGLMPAFNELELYHSAGGTQARIGESTITNIKNLINRFQEKIRKVENAYGEQ